MERQFFNWENFKIINEGSSKYQFYNCVLNMDMGNFRSGEKIDIIYMAFAEEEESENCNGTMIFYDKDYNQVAIFKLGLVIL